METNNSARLIAQGESNQLLKNLMVCPCRPDVELQAKGSGKALTLHEDTHHGLTSLYGEGAHP